MNYISADTKAERRGNARLIHFFFFFSHGDSRLLAVILPGGVALPFPSPREVDGIFGKSYGAPYDARPHRISIDEIERSAWTTELISKMCY